MCATLRSYVIAIKTGQAEQIDVWAVNYDEICKDGICQSQGIDFG